MSLLGSIALLLTLGAPPPELTRDAELARAQLRSAREQAAPFEAAVDETLGGFGLRRMVGKAANQVEVALRPGSGRPRTRGSSSPTP